MDRFKKCTTLGEQQIYTQRQKYSEQLVSGSTTLYLIKCALPNNKTDDLKRIVSCDL